MKTAYTLIAAFALAAAGAAFGAEEAADTTAAAATVTSAAAAGTPSVAITEQAPKQRGLTRAEVRAQVIAARKNGTLIETEADMDVAQTRRQYAR